MMTVECIFLVTARNALYYCTVVTVTVTVTPARSRISSRSSVVAVVVDFILS